MSIKSILVKMFGKPRWPFALRTLADTNPCLAATQAWCKAERLMGRSVGMVWYCINGRLDSYHCVGFFERDGKRICYDPQTGREFRLTKHELIGANWIGPTKAE